MQVSKRLEQFPEYIFSKLAKEAKIQEKITGKKILNLSIGSPSFSPSKLYIQKLKEFIDFPGSTLYPGYGATSSFAHGLIDWYKTRFNVDLNENELFPLLGAKDGVSHISMALANEGDEILIPDPGYPSYAGSTQMVGCTAVFYSLLEKDNFKLSVSEIEKKITKKTRMLWVNFPSNPTGQVATLEELIPLIKLCKKNDIWLIYDNAYAEITFDGYRSPSILEIPDAKDVAVELGSFSKMYSFAGFRMGWIVGNAQAIAALAKIKSQIDSGMSGPLQKLAAFALANPDREWHTKMIIQYEKNKETVMKAFSRLGLQMESPRGALYLWGKIPNNTKNSYTFSMELMKNKHILITPGVAFGIHGDRYVRICFSGDITRLSHYL